MFVLAFKCAYMCLWMCVYVYTGLHACVWVFTCVYMCFYVLTCVYMQLHVLKWLYVYVYVYICAYVFLYVPTIVPCSPLWFSCLDEVGQRRRFTLLSSWLFFYRAIFPHATHAIVCAHTETHYYQYSVMQMQNRTTLKCGVHRLLTSTFIKHI